MEWSAHEKDLKSVQDRGFKVAALDKKPKILPQAVPYWTAFCEIARGRRRDSNGSILAISPSEVESWLNLRGWTDPDVRMMVYDIVTDTDAGYFEALHNKRQQEEREASNGKT